MIQFKQLRKDFVEEYEKNLPCFEEVRQRLSDIFESLLNEKASSYGLIGQNIYGDVKYFEIKTRVKKTSSIQEKFLRKDFGLRILTIGEFESTQMLSKIKGELDDLIGLRIITWSKNDKKNAFNLIKESNEILKEKGVTFVDISNQPQIMKNEFEIYRIKGLFEEIFFELQIKCRIEDAWAEIEHTQFYKNPDYSRERNVYKSMIHKCYEILEKVDDTLYEIREGSGNNRNISDHIRLEESLKKLSPLIKNVLGYNVDLARFQPLILNLNISEITEIKLNLNGSVLKGVNPFYGSARAISWDLIISEGLFLSVPGNEPVFSSYLDFIIEIFITLKLDVSKADKSQIIVNALKKFFAIFWTTDDLDKYGKKIKATLTGFAGFDKVMEDVTEKLGRFGEILSYTNDDYSSWSQDLKDAIASGLAAFCAKDLTSHELVSERLKLLTFVKKKLEEDVILEELESLNNNIEISVLFDFFGLNVIGEE